MRRCVILILMLFVGSACNANRYGTVQTLDGTKCNYYHFRKSGTLPEAKILNDLVLIKNNKSIGLIADYRDEVNYYITVFARPGQDLEARNLVLSMGWESSKEVPKGLKEKSRVLTNQSIAPSN